MMTPHIITVDEIEQGDGLRIVDYVNEWEVQAVITSIHDGIVRMGVEFEFTVSELRTEGVEITLTTREDEA